ncbi:MAG: hypothetical protein R2697_12655 [Ilumatobacteraceae bacterium]
MTGTTLTLAVETDGRAGSAASVTGGRLDPENVARHVDGRFTVQVGAYAEPAAARSRSRPPPAIEAASTDAESSERRVDRLAERRQLSRSPSRRTLPLGARRHDTTPDRHHGDGRASSRPASVRG